jgi:outer membrane protein TolC
VQGDLDERRYREAREALAIETTNLYFDVVAARTSLETAVQNAARNDTLYTLNRGRYEVGKIGENDLLQSELQLLRARTAMDEARLRYDRAVETLRLGLQLPAGESIEVELRADVPAVQADTARAVAEALRNRAMVSDVELQHVRARRGVSEARWGGAIGATVTASIGLNATAPEANLAYRNLLEARRVTVAVDLPLWQWGARGEGLRAARAEEDRTASMGRQALDQLGHVARFAVLELAQARRALVLSATADTVAGKRFEVAYNRYVIGRISLDNLFIAQNEKDQAQVQFVQALRNYWLAYYRLRQATLFDFERGAPIH